MIGEAQRFLRKASTVAQDPTLRSWLWEGLVTRRPRYKLERSRPPYLDAGYLSSNVSIDIPMADLVVGMPSAPLDITLLGTTLAVYPGRATDAFNRHFEDVESLLALHRFAWIGQSEEIDSAWVEAMWTAWMHRFGRPDDSWAWHPYTAAERLINILSFAVRSGLPGDRFLTLQVLAAHGPAILERLEYFGEGCTGNHLANNGRGLFLGGLLLHLNDWVEVGEKILLNEASRIFLSSGVLREGSTHYHLLVARWYAEVAEAAAKASRESASEFRAFVSRALAIVPLLHLPGGLPLIGDISPDRTPASLLGWIQSLGVLEQVISDVDRRALSQDGWQRFDAAHWHGLVRCDPEGWNSMPGHGHRDFASAEVHYDNQIVLCDLGRRCYAADGDRDLAASAHNTLTIDDYEAYPTNRMYYDSEFRCRVAPPPRVEVGQGTVAIVTNAFGRLPGVGEWRREWRAERDRLTIVDSIDGRGRRLIRRCLHTVLATIAESDGLTIGAFRAIAEGNVTVKPTKRWKAYGVGELANHVEITNEVELPWTGKITITLQ